MPLWRSSENVLLGPHMFSVHTDYEKKLFIWNENSWTLRKQALRGKKYIYLLCTGIYKSNIFGANTSGVSDVRRGFHTVQPKEEMTTLVEECAYIISWSCVNRNFQVFSHMLNRNTLVVLFCCCIYLIAHNQTQLIICTGTSMADSGLCFFACKRS